jgi:transcriptional regulator with XRE-family HTH domain
MRSENLGTRIRMIMEQKDISTKELAKRTGLEKDFLESLQSDDVYPSLGPLLKVARALGVRLGTFLDDKVSEDPLVIRTSDRTEEIVTHRGTNKPVALTFHSLGRGKTDRHMEPFYIDVFPESSRDKRLSSHEGEEFIIVESGSIEVIYGSSTYVLYPGDSIYYNSVVPHYVSCAGEEKATIYAVLYFPD